MLRLYRPAWSPLEFGGRLASWFDAPDQGTFSFATGVSQWRDKGPFARHLVQATTDSQPAWSATGLDGASRPGITLDGTDDFLTSPHAPLYAAGSAAIYIVCRAPSSATSRGLFGETSSSSNTPLYLLRAGVSTGSSLAAIVRNDANTSLVANTVLSTLTLNSSVVIIGVIDDGANLTPRINGTAGTPVAYTRSGVFTINKTSVGAISASTNTNFMACSIGAIVTVAPAPTTTEAQMLEGYLAHRHGALSALAATNPFKSAPP